MRILKFRLLTSAVMILLMMPIMSQGIDADAEEPTEGGMEYPNVIKINTLALMFQNVSLVYERGIIPRVSAGIGLGYKYAGTEPKLLAINNSAINADIGKIHGFSITPEAKYYIRSCDVNQLDGFYVGLYMRYTGYKADAQFDYLPEATASEVYQSDISLKEYGVGLQLGYQLIIKERFSIDFLFLGPRMSSYKMAYEFDSTPSQEFLDDFSDHLNEVVDRLGFDYDVDIQKDGAAQASTSFLFANTRFGLSLGYVF